MQKEAKGYCPIGYFHLNYTIHGEIYSLPVFNCVIKASIAYFFDKTY